MGTGDNGEARAPNSRPHELRASDSDRDRTLNTLTAAFAHDLIDKGEFDRRVNEALAARTLNELTFILADIPVNMPSGPIGAPPSRLAEKNEGRKIAKALPSWLGNRLRKNLRDDSLPPKRYIMAFRPEDCPVCGQHFNGTFS